MRMEEWSLIDGVFNTRVLLWDLLVSKSENGTCRFKHRIYANVPAAEKEVFPT